MIDLVKNTTADVMIANADLVLGFSDRQHMEDLLLIEKGAIKQFPEAGVGAQEFLESEDPAGLLREISLQFAADGMNVKKVAYDANGKVIIDAAYQ